MAWNIDETHTHVGFAVRHMVVSWARGKFDAVRGTFVIDENNPLASSVEAEVDVASVNTGNTQRDGHLLSPDFFDAEKYPTISFKSTSVEADGDNYKVTGDLTMHGVTKPVVFDVESSGIVVDPYGLKRLGLNAKAKISRKEFGLKYSALLETGAAIIGDEIRLELEVEAVTPAQIAAQ